MVVWGAYTIGTGHGEAVWLSCAFPVLWITYLYCNHFGAGCCCMRRPQLQVARHRRATGTVCSSGSILAGEAARRAEREADPHGVGAHLLDLLDLRELVAPDPDWISYDRKYTRPRGEDHHPHDRLGALLPAGDHGPGCHRVLRHAPVLGASQRTGAAALLLAES